MELISISTGSWFPRTKLHLKEFYTFLKEGTSHLHLDPERVKMYHSQLKPREVEYKGGTFDKVVASINDVQCTYHEDGLLVLDIDPGDDPVASIDKLNTFYHEQLSGTLSYLYSIGSPVVSYNIAHIGVRTVVIHTKGATDDSARIFCAELGEDVHFIARHPDRTVYFATGIILINDDSSGMGTTRYIIDHLILFREYEHKLRHYLELHRSLWETIASIQARKSVPAAELPAIRNALLDHKRDLTVIRARIDQMRAYIEERRHAIDALGIEEDMRAVEAYRFGKIDASTAYIARLWGMLDEYLHSTVDLIGFLTQENLQKEIGIQQLIFLVGAMAALISLGTITVQEYELGSLLRFGGAAFGGSIIIFFIMAPLMKRFIRTSSQRIIGRASDTKPDTTPKTMQNDIDDIKL